MTKHNVGVALSSFPQLEESRKKEILQAAEQLMEDKDAQDLIDELVDGFRNADRIKKAKAAEAS
jgi:hypothetical protein